MPHSAEQVEVNKCEGKSAAPEVVFSSTGLISMCHNVRAHLSSRGCRSEFVECRSWMAVTITSVDTS